LKSFQNYELKHKKVTLSLCFNIQSTVETYCAEDVYIHVFLTTSLHTDVPLNAISDSYLSGNKRLWSYWLRGMVLGENGGTGERKGFHHVQG